MESTGNCTGNCTSIFRECHLTCGELVAQQRQVAPGRVSPLPAAVPRPTPSLPRHARPAVGVGHSTRWWVAPLVPPVRGGQAGRVGQPDWDEAWDKGQQVGRHRVVLGEIPEPRVLQLRELRRPPPRQHRTGQGWRDGEWVRGWVRQRGRPAMGLVVVLCKLEWIIRIGSGGVICLL